MRILSMVFAASMFLIFTGCAASSTFDMNGSQALKSESEFGSLTARPDVFRGKAIKMAGRIIGVETTSSGTMMTAEWLPYPDVEYEGPEDTGVVTEKQFTLFYPDALDVEGRLHGNKFLVLGTMESTQGMMVGKTGALPHVTARCLHVWKTGDAAIETEPDVEFAGYSVSEETYCSKT